MSVQEQFVNRQPTQLMRLLGLSGPDAPNRLAELISGTIDLTQWLFEATASALTATLTPGVAALGNQTASFTVPAGQRWAVTRLVTSATLAAAHTYQFGVYQGYAGGQPTFACGTPSGIFTGPAFVLHDALGPALIIGNPGDQFGLALLTNTGAAPSIVTVNIRFTSFAA